MSLDVSSVSKFNSLKSPVFEYLDEFKQLHKNKNFETLQNELINKITSLKKDLVKKPHHKKLREELKNCFLFLIEISSQDPEILLPKVKKTDYKLKPLKVVKALFMDNLIENEWKKQCNGKYGGEKKVDLSWKDWYIKNEYEVEKLVGIEVKMKWAVENGHINYFKFLLSQNSDITLDDIKFDNNISLLSKMIIEDYVSFCSFLMELTIDLNSTDNRGWRPIHYAVFYGNLKIVEKLIEKKVPLNQKDKFGLTPIHIAAIKGYNDILKCLLKSGAKVNFKDSLGNSPVLYSVLKNEYSAIEILLNFGCDLTIKDKYGRGLLHLVCILGYSNLISLLVKNRMNVNLKDNFGKTPLHYSSQCANLACQEVLLKHNANVSIVDKFEDTPMLIAAFFDNTQELNNLYEVSTKEGNF